MGLKLEDFMESQSQLLMIEENQQTFQETSQATSDLQAKIQAEAEQSESSKMLYLSKGGLTREKTLEIFYQQQKLEREAWQRVRRLQDSEIKDEFNVQNVYMADFILIKFGVTSRQYNQALIDFDLMDEPEVQAELEKSKMPDELLSRVMNQLSTSVDMGNS